MSDFQLHTSKRSGVRQTTSTEMNGNACIDMNSQMLSKSYPFELFLRPPPACYNPHGHCGLFDFEVLCSIMCSFPELIKKINFTQSERPPPRRSSANKMVWKGCQIWNGSLSLQNSPGVLTAQFQLVFILYSENSSESNLTKHFTLPPLFFWRVFCKCQWG